MVEDPRAANEGSGGEPRLRAGGGPARPAPRGEGAVGSGAGGERNGVGAVVLTEPQLEAWGERIGATAPAPLFLAIRGELGAGKSVLARAIARGAGVRGPMPSPTFNLVYRYDTPSGVTVSHLDLYRLDDADDVWELGWSELGRGNELVLVEWPERAESLLASDRWDIFIEPSGDPSRRSVHAVPVGTVSRIPPPEAEP